MFLFTTNLLALNILFPPGGNAAACSNTASCFGEAKHEMEMADRCYIFCHHAGLHHNFGSKGHRQDVILQSWRLGSETNDMQIGRSKTTTDLPALCLSICIFVKSPLFFAAFMFRSVQFFFTGQEKKYKILFIEKQKKVFWNMGERFRFTAGAVSASSSVFQGSELCMPLVPEPAEGSLYRPIYILSYFHLLHTWIVRLKLMSGSQI